MQNILQFGEMKYGNFLDLSVPGLTSSTFTQL